MPGGSVLGALACAGGSAAACVRAARRCVRHALTPLIALHALTRPARAHQIVSTFLKSLDIPWPNIFGVVMARVNVINLNLVQARARR